VELSPMHWEEILDEHWWLQVLLLASLALMVIYLKYVNITLIDDEKVVTFSHKNHDFFNFMIINIKNMFHDFL
jgi:hypothetical protein